MTGDYLALGALALSLVTFIVTQVRTQKTASAAGTAAAAARIADFETRIARLETELKTSRAEVERLEDENLRLMRKLLANGVQ